MSHLSHKDRMISGIIKKMKIKGKPKPYVKHTKIVERIWALFLSNSKGFRERYFPLQHLLTMRSIETPRYGNRFVMMSADRIMAEKVSNHVADKYYI